MDEVQELQADLNQQFQRNKRLTASNQRLNQKAQRAEAQVRKLEREAKKLKAQLGSAKSTIASLKACQTIVSTTPVAPIPPSTILLPQADPALQKALKKLQDPEAKLVVALRNDQTLRLKLEGDLAMERTARTSAEAALKEERKLSEQMGVQVDQMEKEMRASQDLVAAKIELLKRGTRRIDELEKRLAKLDMNTEAKEKLRKDYEDASQQLKDQQTALALTKQDLVTARQQLEILQQNEQGHLETVRVLQAELRKAEKECGRAKGKAEESRQAFLKMEVEKNELQHALNTIRTTVMVKTEPRD